MDSCVISLVHYCARVEFLRVLLAENWSALRCGARYSSLRSIRRKEHFLHSFRRKQAAVLSYGNRWIEKSAQKQVQNASFLVNITVLHDMDECGKGHETTDVCWKYLCFHIFCEMLRNFNSFYVFRHLYSKETQLLLAVKILFSIRKLQAITFY